MNDEEWGLGWVRSLGVMLNGETLGDVDETGESIKDFTFLLMLNCHHEPIKFFPPKPGGAEKWEILVDTKDPELPADSRFCEPGDSIELVPLSLVLAREAKPPSITGILSPELR